MTDTVTTILNQLLILDRTAFLRWGAKEKVRGKDYIRFKTSGLVRWKGYVTVRYVYGKDLYRIEFGRVRKMQYKIDKMVEDVYAEDMVKTIDEKVG